MTKVLLRKGMGIVRRHMGVFVSGLLGAGLFFYLYGDIFLPSHTAWILTDGWDTFQHQIGWEFFRHAPWAFPIGINSSYGYPVGISIVYTDSIPLLALPLKLFSTWLPAAFQYLGIWTLLCFILQGIFGFYLSRLTLRGVLPSIIASVFFIVSSIMLMRIGGHAALTGHWIILAALLLVLTNNGVFRYWHWTAMIVIALLVHPYLFFMVGGLMLADVLRTVIVKKAMSLWRAGFFLLSEAILSIFVSYVLGVFYIGNATAGGFGEYSMNLDALFNPYWGPWSIWLYGYPTGPYQYEGFNYLGAGILALLLVWFFSLVFKKARRQYVAWLRDYWPLMALLLIFTFVAISNHIWLHDHKLAAFDLPKSLSTVLATIRASGRFFWPVYYLLFLLGLSVIGQLRQKALVIVMVISALALHLTDLSGALARERVKYAHKEWSSSLSEKGIFGGLACWPYKHMVFVPASDLRKAPFKDSTYVPLALFAAKQGMTINDGIYARMIKDNNKHLADQVEELKQGKIDAKTIYVFKGDPKDYITNISESDYIEVFKDVTIFVRGPLYASLDCIF